MELSQLEAFLAVVREGSFSAAAKALYRTQPAISQTIKRLEDEVGHPLFDRTSRRGMLTDAGRVLAVHAERLINFRNQALTALDDVRQLRAGRLTVAANELTVVLDVIADRVLLPVDAVFGTDEHDRLAAATMAVLRRGIVSLRVLEPWIARLAAAGRPAEDRDGAADHRRDPRLDTGNAQAFLRSLYLQLALGPRPPEVRSDLLLVVVDALRSTNPAYLQAAQPR